MTTQDRSFFPDFDNPSSSQAFDIWVYVDMAKRRALYFLIPFLLAAAAGAVIVMKIPAIFESKATILVESQQIPQDLVKSTVSALAAERLQVIEQLVKARDNILVVADKFNVLANKPNLSQTERVEEIKSRIRIAPVELSLAGRRARDDRLTVAFTVSFEDESPVTAARVANELVTIVLNEDAKSRSSRASETTKFLEKEAGRVSVDLAALDRQISDFRLEHSQALPEKLQFNMSLLERTEKSLSDTERDVLAIDEEKRLLMFEASVRTAASQANLTPTAQGELQRQVDALTTEIAAKSAIYAPTHPEMKTLRNALAGLEAELERSLAKPAEKPKDGAADAPEIKRVDVQLVDQKIQSLEERRAFLLTQAKGYEKTAKDLRDVIVRTPEIGAQLGGLERRRESLQRSMEDVTSKLAQARLGERLEQDQQGERFEVIEQPITPQEPTRPDRRKLMILSLAMAAAAGGGIAFLAEFLDSRIRTTTEFASRIGSRPFVVIPYIPTKAERRRSMLLWVSIVVVFLLTVATILTAVHLYFMPLDLLMIEVMKKIQ